MHLIDLGLGMKFLKNSNVRIEPLKAWTLKSMIWCNKIWSSLFINKVPILLLFILIPCSVLYEYSSLHLLHCTWLECIKSYTKNPSYGFFTRRWFIHNQFMVLVNSLKDVMYYLLIRRMISLGQWDGIPILSTLVCMVQYWIGPTVSHDLRLSSGHDFTKLLHCIAY